MRVIPELDSPGHSRSWGLSKKYENIVACASQKGHEWMSLCPEIPCGQLDPTLNETYEVVEGIFKEVNTMFPDKFVHLGGDEVSFNCWKNKTSIKTWMVANNITSYLELENLYRKNQRKLIKNRTAIYWFQNFANPINSDDIGQYWGQFTGKETFLKNATFKMIVSPYNLIYLNSNNADIFKNLYNFDPTNHGILNKTQVIGAEACLWGEEVNSDNLETKLWPRLSAFAESMWSGNTSKGYLIAAQRLVKFSNLLRSRGFQVDAFCSEYCSLHLDQCY